MPDLPLPPEEPDARRIDQLTAEFMASLTPEHLEVIRGMDADEARSFMIKVLRGWGLNWYRVSRVVNLTIAETRRSAKAYSWWPFD